MCDSWASLPHAGQVGQLATLGLHLNEPEAVIICTVCKYAIQTGADRVSRHLSEKHEVDQAARRGLGAFLRSLRLADPDKLKPRQDGSPPHPHLLMVNAFECTLCCFRSRSSEVLVRHLSKEHSSTRDNMEEGLKVQSWTNRGKRGYWRVLDDPAHIQQETSMEKAISSHPNLIDTQPKDPVLQQISMPNIISTGRQNHVEELVHTEQQQIYQNAMNNQVYSENDIGELNITLLRPWINRTGWAKTFQDARRDVLFRLIQSPDPGRNKGALELGSLNGIVLSSSFEDEAKLIQMSNATDLFLSRCEETNSQNPRL